MGKNEFRGGESCPERFGYR